MKYFYILLSLFIFLSCQNGDQNQSGTSDQDTQIDGFMKDRPTGEQNWNWAFLTNQHFHYRAKVTVGQETSKEDYLGKWIDMESDGTFEQGKFAKTTYTGVWSYDHEKSQLTLYPDPKTEKNSQWKIKYSDDIVILIGTSKYGDNATQIQLVRNTEKPKK